MAWRDRCETWEYKNVPGCDAILRAHAIVILRWLAAISPDDKIILVLDTRDAHERYFNGLTPARFPHYAGHYRGENFECLIDYEVSIATNRLVGHTAGSIPVEMETLKPAIRATIARIDEVWPVNERVFSKAAKIRRMSELIAALFAMFLEIHPYANGNGHAGRLIVTAIFARYGVYLRRFPVDPRPQDPPYSDLIREYQNGRTEGFIRFLIQCI
jgi:Fic/DOC family